MILWLDFRSLAHCHLLTYVYTADAFSLTVEATTTVVVVVVAVIVVAQPTTLPNTYQTTKQSAN